MEAEHAARLATEIVGLEVLDLMVNEEAAFRTEKRKICQVSYNRRKKKRKLEVLVNWGEKDEVRLLQVDFGGEEGENHSGDMDAGRWVSLNLTVSVASLQDDTRQRSMCEYTMPPSEMMANQLVKQLMENAWSILEGSILGATFARELI